MQMSESSSDGTSHFAQGVPVDAVVPQIVLRYAQIHLRVNSRVNNMIKIKIERNESNQIKLNQIKERYRPTNLEAAKRSVFQNEPTLGLAVDREDLLAAKKADDVRMLQVGQRV